MKIESKQHIVALILIMYHVTAVQQQGDYLVHVFSLIQDVKNKNCGETLELHKKKKSIYERMSGNSLRDRWQLCFISYCSTVLSVY